MTLLESENILDIVSEALLAESISSFHPLSSLKGFSLYEIDTALKLRCAHEYLYLSLKGNYSDEFESIKNKFGGIPFSIESLFVEDSKLQKLQQLEPNSREYRSYKIKISPNPLNSSFEFKDQKSGELETIDSVCNYCEYLGNSDKLYWQKIYTRIGLEYTSDSPSKNDCFLVEQP